MGLRTDHLPYPPVGGLKCIFEWHLDEITQFMFEVPTSTVMPFLPRGVYPVEPRPGISLLDIGHVRWGAGNWAEHWPAFNEVTVLLVVQPDFSFPMPMPKFAFFAINICANHQEFLDTEPVTLHLPTFFSPLKETYTKSPHGVEVVSDIGPVIQLRNTQEPIHYEPVDYIGQFFSVENGMLYFGLWQWIADAAEHQVPGDAGRVFNHPVFRGMNVEGCRNVYLQLFSKPGTGSVQRFYQPFALGPAVFDNRPA